MQADFGPSDLLCPKAYCWVPLSRVRHALEQVSPRAGLNATPIECPLVLAGSHRAVRAVQPGFVAISELPGAVEGLGPEHNIQDGVPAPQPAQVRQPPRSLCTQSCWPLRAGRSAPAAANTSLLTLHAPQPSEEEVASTRLLIPSPGAGSGRGRGRVVQFGNLCESGLLSEGIKGNLLERLTAWVAVMGPAWRDTVYQL